MCVHSLDDPNKITGHSAISMSLPSPLTVATATLMLQFISQLLIDWFLSWFYSIVSTVSTYYVGDITYMIIEAASTSKSKMCCLPKMLFFFFIYMCV